MERLHHYKKEILRKEDADYKLIIEQDQSFLEFIENLDTLNTSKWNKLYAILAELNQKTHRNYRIYQDDCGKLYDVTTHKFITEEDLGNEKTQRDVELKLFDNSQLGKLRRVHFELKQVDLKIDNLKAHKVSLLERQAKLLECEI